MMHRGVWNHEQKRDGMVEKIFRWVALPIDLASANGKGYKK